MTIFTHSFFVFLCLARLLWSFWAYRCWIHDMWTANICDLPWRTCRDYSAWGFWLSYWSLSGGQSCWTACRFLREVQGRPEPLEQNLARRVAANWREVRMMFFFSEQHSFMNWSRLRGRFKTIFLFCALGIDAGSLGSSIPRGWWPYPVFMASGSMSQTLIGVRPVATSRCSMPSSTATW